MFSGIINIQQIEFADNNKAYLKYKVCFFNLTLFSKTIETTNRETVNSLKTLKKVTIKGFNNESNNKD